MKHRSKRLPILLNRSTLKGPAPLPNVCPLELKEVAMPDKRLAGLVDLAHGCDNVLWGGGVQRAGFEPANS